MSTRDHGPDPDGLHPIRESTESHHGVAERFDHVAMAVRDIERILPLLDLIGARFRRGGENERGDFRWCQFALPGAGTIELIQPLSEDPAHFLNRFLVKRGEGLHHVTFKVPDLEAAVAHARDLGFEVVGIARESATWKEAFVHPRSAGGVLVQLAEWEDQPDPSDSSVWDVIRSSAGS